MASLLAACCCGGCVLCGAPRDNFTITVAGISLCPGFSGVPSGTFILPQFQPTLCTWQNQNIGAGSVGSACGRNVNQSGHYGASISLATGFGPPVQLSVSISADFGHGGLFGAIIPLTTAQAVAFCRDGMTGIANQADPGACCAGFGGDVYQGGYGGTISIFPGP